MGYLFHGFYAPPRHFESGEGLDIYYHSLYHHSRRSQSNLAIRRTHVKYKPRNSAELATSLL